MPRNIGTPQKRKFEPFEDLPANFDIKIGDAVVVFNTKEKGWVFPGGYIEHNKTRAENFARRMNRLLRGEK